MSFAGCARDLGVNMGLVLEGIMHAIYIRTSCKEGSIGKRRLRKLWLLKVWKDSTIILTDS